MLTTYGDIIKLSCAQGEPGEERRGESGKERAQRIIQKALEEAKDLINARAAKDAAAAAAAAGAHALHRQHSDQWPSGVPVGLGVDV